MTTERDAGYERRRLLPSAPRLVCYLSTCDSVDRARPSEYEIPNRS
jgi:hypothetical protein